MKKMLKIIAVLTMFVFIFGATSCGDVVENEQDDFEGTTVKIGDVAPSFVAEINDGSTFNMVDQEQKVVLINFWATWCGPCVEEMPAFEKLNNEYGDELSIICVNVMEEKKVVDKFVEENGYTFPIAYDEEDKIGSLYPTQGIPYTLVIGKDGKVANMYIGAYSADEQYKEYKSAIDEALEK